MLKRFGLERFKKRSRKVTFLIFTHGSAPFATAASGATAGSHIAFPARQQLLCSTAKERGERKGGNI